MRKAKFSFLQFFILLIGGIIIFVIYMFNDYGSRYLIKINQTNNLILNVEKEEYNLNYLILKNSLFLDTNFDEIANSIKNIELKTNLLKASLLGIKYSLIKYYDDYKRTLEEKIHYIYEFQKINKGFKNSVLFLTTFPSKMYHYRLSKNYQKEVINIISSIYLTRLTQDTSFIKNININYFKNLKFKNPNLKRLNDLFIEHIEFIKNNLNNYNFYMKKITDNSSITKLNILKSEFTKVTNNIIKNYKIIGYGSIAILGIMFIILLILIRIIEKDKESFKKLAYTDNITDLYNTNKFLEDEKKFNTILLLNIEGFRNINELYGREVGNQILKEIGKYIKNLTPNSYRLNGDNFAILTKHKEEAKNYFNTILEEFDKFVYYVDKSLEFQISFKAAISDTKPLLKTAEIAIHYIKKNKRIRCIEYSLKLDNTNQIKENIKKSTILSYALKNDKIIPYFQPIVDVKTGKIVKYEVLTRIDNQGKLESIFPYLEIAKDNRLYNEITKTIIEKSFKTFYNTNSHFSVNLSIDDILDVEIISFLRKKFKQYRGIEKQLTFEILESEAINDYHQIQKFINLMKQKTIEFAIDDFGSGYSNFTHIANLDIDYIKIDGSLIKNIDKDKVSFHIVKLITDFAKRHNIKTVAEFVHNETVFNIIKLIGVDYAQGFYLYKPLPKIITN